MSDNKNKYFRFDTTTVVAAPTKAEALQLALNFGKRRQMPQGPGMVLAAGIAGERIYAPEAHVLVDAIS